MPSEPAKTLPSSPRPIEVESFADLMDQLCSGSEEAAWKIVERFTPHILRVVRQSLPKEIRSKVDSVDLVNTLLGSILTNRTRLAHIQDPAQLIALLTKAARNRVIDEHRHYTKYSTRSIRSEEGTFDDRGSAETDSGTGVAGDGRFGGREQTPSQVAIAREQWDRLLATLSRRDREIVSLRIQGKKYAEIALLIEGVSARTARRVVTGVTEQLLG